ncbi:unnamed protein product [Mytilus coruscus]|uniref:C1q domain-containing protein n=1 Tax=Mytilus coruscus TaxID=42192 RepID=A0A6J8AIV6_MYTCO|nr:unnamed protein product [Mytilus coruscus]
MNLSYMTVLYLFQAYTSYAVHESQEFKELKLLIVEQSRRLDEIVEELVKQKAENSRQDTEIVALRARLASYSLNHEYSNDSDKALTVQKSDARVKEHQEIEIAKNQSWKGHINDTETVRVNDRLPDTRHGMGRSNYDDRKRLLVPAATTVTPRPPVIAFSAYMSKTEYHVVDHKILTFDVVQVNEGNGYNKHTGSFIVPQSGVYVFTYTLLIYSNSDVCTDLIINGAIYGHVYGFSGSLDVRQTATSIVVTRVNKGDTVFVRTASDGRCGQTGAFYGDTWRRSAFAGWLLG